MIKTETYEWIKEQLKQAARDSVILLPVAHHNLLEESKVYADDCTIEHSEELIQMLEGRISRCFSADTCMCSTS